MKKSLKLISLVAALSFAFALAGCSNSTGDSSSGGGSHGGGGQGGGGGTTPPVLTDLETPLTLEATADCKITLTKPWSTLKYKVNDGELTAVTSSEISIKENDKISFFAEGSENTDNVQFHIYFDKDCYVYGNIMSLVSLDIASGKWNSSAKTLTTKKCFAYLFENNYHIKFHDNKSLILPATTLADYCYYKMFKCCKTLTSVPALPATTLADHCYDSMFEICSSLTSAPSLPATILADSCYSSMFEGCTSLTSAPVLPATTLADDCYSHMFDGCTSLTSAPALSATILMEGCYNCMFAGCTSLTSAPALSATVLMEGCYNSMFTGCTSLTSAPALPAKSLVEICYAHMFENCTSLTSAPALSATTLADACYSFMFKNCTSLSSAPALPATTLTDSCYSYMFEGCTSLTSAPELPASKLVKYCYQDMFYGCQQLNYIECLATDISARNCTSDWVKDVAASGTFIKADSMTNWSTWSTGADGIPSGWTVKDVNSVNSKKLPLTLEAIADCNITLINPWTALKYKINNGELTAVVATGTNSNSKPISEIPISANDTISFFAEGTENTSSDFLTIDCDADCYVYGNVMSLIDPDNFKTAISLENTQFAFALLFYENEHIKNHSSKALVLPATTLASGCYYGMFNECSGLTEAPELPAKTLVEGCYGFMFTGCSNLKSITCLATDISAHMSTTDWVLGVPGDGTFTKDPFMDGWPTSGAGIPSGWTVKDYNQ